MPTESIQRRTTPRPGVPASRASRAPDFGCSPIYGVLLALSTLTQQPDYETDFRGYAEYITTDRFLVSHLGASIAGAALGLLGAVATLLFLVRGPAVTAAIVGTMVATALGWGDVASIALAVAFAFLFGYSLTSLPLLRARLPFAAIVPIALATDTVSIAIMEFIDNGFMLLVPGAMEAGLGDIRN